MRGKKQAAAFRSFTVLLPPTNRVKNKIKSDEFTKY